LQRPKYGYFLDDSVDAFCDFFIMTGLGVTLYVRMDVALFVLIGYYMLCMYVFLNDHVTGMFQLSFLALGPTELRIGLIGINTFRAGEDRRHDRGRVRLGSRCCADVRWHRICRGFHVPYARREATQRETLSPFKRREP
jgi:hypothetical protein